MKEMMNTQHIIAAPEPPLTPSSKWPAPCGRVKFKDLSIFPKVKLNERDFTKSTRVEFSKTESLLTSSFVSSYVSLLLYRSLNI